MIFLYFGIKALPERTSQYFPLCLSALSVLLISPVTRAEMEVQVLPTIVVKATRNDQTILQSAASTYVINQADVQQQQPKINLSESLSRVPGIQVQNRQNYAQDLQLSIRGFGARSTFGVRGVRLYVDDIPATMPDGQGQTSNIDLGSVDRIEVVNGSLSSLYGNSSGGTIQAFTEEGKNPPQVMMDVSAGNDGLLRYGVKASAGQNDLAPAYVLSTNRFSTDGYRPHSQAEKNMANAKLVWKMSDGDQLKLIINHVDLEADDPLGITRAQWQQDRKATDPVAIQFNTRKTVDQTQTGLVYEKPLADHQTIRVMGYAGQRQTTQYQSIPVFVQTQKPGWQGHAGGVIDLGRDYYGLDLRWIGKDLLTSQKSTLIAGLAFDQVVEDRKGYENFIGSGQQQLLGVKGKLRRNETNVLWNLDPYLQGSWQFLPDWRIDAGLRYSSVYFKSDDHYQAVKNGDDSGDANYHKLLPSMALDWSVRPDLNTYLSYGKGFETPTFNEISYRSDGQSGLNFDLQPAQNNTYELGAKYRIAHGLLTAAVFRVDTDNEIVVVGNNNGRTTYKNAGQTLRQGLEVSWDGDLSRTLKSTLAYTDLSAKYHSNTATFLSGNRLPGVAGRSAYADLEWQPIEGWRLGTDIRYLSKIYVDDKNTDTAPAYTITGIHASYGWQRNNWALNGFVRVDNLLDKKYIGSVIVNESNGRYFEPAAGRNWGAGLSVRYQY